MDWIQNLKRDEICSLITGTEVFRSVLYLNTANREVRDNIKNMTGLRKNILSAFDMDEVPKNDLRLLFNIGRDVILSRRTAIKLTVQNHIQIPTWERLREIKYVHSYKNIVSLNHPDYSQPLKYPMFEKNSIYRFELVAFPSTKTNVNDRASTMKFTFEDKTAIMGSENQIAWLRKHSTINGFRLIRCGIVNLVNRRIEQDKHGNPGSIMEVIFRGTLMVTDPVLFDCVIKLGIGPAKRYGCGLLLLGSAN